MVIATRSNAIYSSPRIEKYLSFYKKNKINHLVVGWDRLEKKLQRENTIYYNQASGYNVGGVKAAINRLKWMFFLLKIIYINRGQVTTVHAFDLDTAFPACVFKVIFNRKVQVIFDICDWFSATLYNQHWFILMIFRKMEAFTIKYSDEVIICEAERIEQIPFPLKRQELIVPNIPSFQDESFLVKEDKYKFANDKVVVSYVGGFSTYRMLEELLTIAEQGHINLLIAGYGSPEIENRCNYSSKKLSNIKYYGKVDYKVGLNLMYNSDVIYAMYSKSNPNHYYAAPNKYYEAMMLGKPIISTKGISLGSKIIGLGIGYIVDEDLNQITSLFHSLEQNEMLEKGLNALKLWNEKYASYTSDFLENHYLKIINHNNK